MNIHGHSLTILIKESLRIIRGSKNNLVSFPGPAQLSIACSTEKRGDPGIFSHVR